METTWLQFGTLVIAVIGAALGVLNTWRTFSNDRVRVRVKATTVYLPVMDRWCLGVEVVNLSSFAITVDAIGCTLRGRGEHIQFPLPTLTTGDRLPKRLEPRTGFTAFADPGATEEVAEFALAECPYVRTACGERILGEQRQLADVLSNLASTGRR